MPGGHDQSQYDAANSKTQHVAAMIHNAFGIRDSVKACRCPESQSDFELLIDIASEDLVESMMIQNQY